MQWIPIYLHVLHICLILSLCLCLCVSVLSVSLFLVLLTSMLYYFAKLFESVADLTFILPLNISTHSPLRTRSFSDKVTLYKKSHWGKLTLMQYYYLLFNFQIFSIILIMPFVDFFFFKSGSKYRIKHCIWLSCLFSFF